MQQRGLPVVSVISERVESADDNWNSTSDLGPVSRKSRNFSGTFRVT